MPIVDFNVFADECHYLGDGEAGCYYQAGAGADGWYVTVVIDVEHFTEDHTVDDGPYSSEEAAASAGRSVALEWCVDNGVTLEEGELHG